MFRLHDSIGSYDASIELGRALPKISINLSIKDLTLRPFLMSTANYDRLGGLFNLNIALLIQKALRKPLDSVNGKGKITIADGVYYGIDLPYEVKRVHALLNNKQFPTKTSSQLTSFDHLDMNFKIVEGILSTDNLIVSAKDYGIFGKGNANFDSQFLDFALQAHSNHDKSFFIPIKITGSFREPSIKLDATLALQRIVKDAMQNVAKEQLQKYKIPSGLKDILHINKILP
jgi:AsmA protein